MTDTQIVVLVQCLFGSGILVTLFRIVFVLGKYAQRVDHLDEAVSKLDRLVESLRTDLENFRERRIQAISDRRGAP